MLVSCIYDKMSQNNLFKDLAKALHSLSHMHILRRDYKSDVHNVRWFPKHS